MVQVTIIPRTVEGLKKYINKNRLIDSLGTYDYEEIIKDPENICLCISNLTKDDKEDMEDATFDITVGCENKVTYRTINRVLEETGQTLYSLYEDSPIMIKIKIKDILRLNRRLDEEAIWQLIQGLKVSPKWRLPHY